MTLFNDVFSADAFQFNNLTEALNKLPYVESRLGQLGLFQSFTEGTETDTVVIDETEGEIKILTTRARNAEPERALKEKKAKARAISIPHMSFEDRIMASSLFGKRKPGTNQLESAVEKVNDSYQRMLNNQLAPTLEVHRLNALRGILVDSDGTTVIHNFFTFFDVAQNTQNYTFSSASTDIRNTCVATARLIEAELNGVPYTGIHALCSPGFFDKLVSHAKVRDTYLNWEAASALRQDVRRSFLFGNIMFEEYRGMSGLPNGLGIIEADTALIFPLGVEGMYRTYYAPGEFMEAVGQLGQPLYAKVAPDMKYNKHVDILMESNPLTINTRPRAVIKATAN